MSPGSFLLDCRISLLLGMSDLYSLLNSFVQLERVYYFFSCQVFYHLQGVRSDSNFDSGLCALCVCVLEQLIFNVIKASEKQAFTHWVNNMATSLNHLKREGEWILFITWTYMGIYWHSTHTHTHTIALHKNILSHVFWTILDLTINR